MLRRKVPVASPKEVPWFFVRLVSPRVLHDCCRLSCSALERRSSKLGGRARSGSATIFPNRNSSRLLGRGSIEIESLDTLVSTCLSDVAHFSVWCCDVLRCFALLVRLLQLLSVRCDVRKRCAGALSCAVLLRALSDCARTRHFGRYTQRLHKDEARSTNT